MTRQLFINSFAKVANIQKMYLAFEFGDLEFQKQLLTQMYDFFIMRLLDQPGLDTRAYRLLDTAGRDISPSDHRSRQQASH